MKKLAIIRKWQPRAGWGVANVPYYINDKFPEKYFVHTSRVVSGDVKLGLGVAILFDAGEPRYPGELPIALNIELAPDTNVSTGASAVKS